MEKEFVQNIHNITKGKSKIPVDLEYKLTTIYLNETSSAAAKAAALRELVEYHTVYLANIVLRVYPKTSAKHNVTTNDLLQVAILRFIEKLQDYKPDSGFRLTTYYTREITTTLSRHMQRYDQVVQRGSPLMQQVAYKVHRIMLDASAKEGREIELDEVLDEIVEKTGHTPEFILNAYHTTSPTILQEGTDGIELVEDIDEEKHIEDILNSSDLVKISLERIAEKIDLSEEETLSVLAFMKDADKGLPEGVRLKLRM